MIRFAACALAVMLTLGTARAADLVVASKIDTEGAVLGQLVLQVLRHGGVPAADRLQLGATPVVRQALLAGEIDLYPEYTGNAGFFFNRADDPVWRDPERGYETARALDLEANRVVWLRAAPANNTWGIALRREVAQRNRLSTLSDFARWVAGGGRVRLAASAEFVNSAAALPAFQQAYGFTLRDDQLLVLSGGDTAATIRAAAQAIDDVNAAMVYGTDGGIAASDLVVLADDRGVQPVYRPAPVVREAALRANPRLSELLDPLFAALTLETLQELNGRVQVDGEPAADVARDFLTTHGFLR